ncbi:MAG: LytR C-terminal domain-containing protein [Actinobacteria bacterium]|nr:LytR C-terminal domain-containing protein [Actinomycetota bacterium]
MRPGNHAAGDGSFGRSAGGAAGRGVALLAVALLIGIILLNATDGDPPGTRVTTESETGADVTEEEGNGEDADGAAATTTPAPPDTPPAAHAPKEVKVIVVNASGVKGAAGKASDLLKPPGYNVLAPTNAKRGETVVYFAPGYEADAAAVAAALGLPPATLKPLPTPPPIPDSKDAQIIVVIGADQGSRFAAGAGAATTSTTAATSTTKRP